MMTNTYDNSKKAWALFITAILMIFLNVIGWIWGGYVSREYDAFEKKYEYIEMEYQQYDKQFYYGDEVYEVTNKLEEYYSELNEGVKRLKKSIYLFVYRWLIDAFLGVFLFFLKIMYEFEKDIFLKYYYDNNWINNICFLIIIGLIIYDFASPFFEVWKYSTLIHEYYSIILKISMKLHMFIL